VESYDELPGIYFENKGQATLYNVEWKTIMYVKFEVNDKSNEYIRTVF
jgi:hypothetical protein